MNDKLKQLRRDFTNELARKQNQLQRDYAGEYADYAYHGGPFDRGGADYYYWREPEPHKWPEGTYRGERVDEKDLTPEEVKAYWAGYHKAEEDGDRKDWGDGPGY